MKSQDLVIQNVFIAQNLNYLISLVFLAWSKSVLVLNLPHKIRNYE